MNIIENIFNCFPMMFSSRTVLGFSGSGSLASSFSPSASTFASGGSSGFSVDVLSSIDIYFQIFKKNVCIRGRKHDFGWDKEGIITRKNRLSFIY